MIFDLKILHPIYVNQFFRALLAVKCPVFFSDQKYVFISHFNETTYSKAYTSLKKTYEKSGQIL